jgi:hypothetical protein
MHIPVRRVVPTVVLGCLAAAVSPSQGQCELAGGMPIGVGSGSGDHFGAAVAACTDRMVIGSPQGVVGGVMTGTARIMRKVNGAWQNEATLVPPSNQRAAGDQFGTAVAIDGNYCVVGAPGNDARGYNAGAAFLYRLTSGTWQFVSSLAHLDVSAGDSFGSSVAMTGDVLAIGAGPDDPAGTNSGKVFVFRRYSESWIHEQAVVPVQAVSYAYFGGSVAVHDNVMVVGAANDDVGGQRTGAAYIFEAQANGSTWTWQQVQRIVAADGQHTDRFGCDVSITDGFVAVGAYRHSPVYGTMSGAAYVFRHDGTSWNPTQMAKLVPSDGASFDDFGVSVAVGPSTIYVGARGEDDMGSSAGAVYEYRLVGETWVELDKLTADDGEPQAFFGCSVAACEAQLLVGATQANSNGLGSGSVYGFSRSGSGSGGPQLDCNENGLQDICDIELGLSADTNLNGIPDECEDSTPTPDPDLDGDGDIDINDLLAVLAQWGGCVDGCPADLNLDGVVNIEDVLIVLTEWNRD